MNPRLIMCIGPKEVDNMLEDFFSTQKHIKNEDGSSKT